MKLIIQKKMYFIANIMELILGGILIVYIVFSIASLLMNMECFCIVDGINSEDFTMNILELIIVIEFAKLIFAHTIDATIDLIAMAIIRHMIVYHLSSSEMFLSVLSVAVLFAIRKYLFKKKDDIVSIESSSQDDVVEI